MKYIISESQMETMISKYLENKGFEIVRKFYISKKTMSKTSSYFFISGNEDSISIRYNRLNGSCYISSELVDELSSMFSIDEYDSKYAISDWVEEKIGFEVELGRVWSTHPDSLVGSSVFDFNESPD